jgi:hypothetical protein
MSESVSADVQESLEMYFHGSVLRAPAVLARGSFLVLAVVLVNTTDNADRGTFEPEQVVVGLFRCGCGTGVVLYVFPE